MSSCSHDALASHSQVKMELFKAEREEVLILLERVSEAQRLATMQMKESDDGGSRGGRKRARSSDAEGFPSGDGKRGGKAAKARK